MSGPITPPLTVTEVDGAPSGRPITTIKVSNGDLTISGNVATIDTSGSGGTPGGSDGQVQYNNAGAFGGDSDFKFDGTTVEIENSCWINGDIKSKVALASDWTLAAFDTTGTTIQGAIYMGGGADEPFIIQAGEAGSDADIRLVPGSGAGKTTTQSPIDSTTTIDADVVRIGDGTDGNEITTNTAEDLVLNTNTGTNSGSITIQEGVNNNIQITPNGTGKVQISGSYTLPTGAGTDTYVMTSDGAGAASWAAAGGGGGGVEALIPPFQPVPGGTGDAQWMPGYPFTTSPGGSSMSIGSAINKPSYYPFYAGDNTKLDGLMLKVSSDSTDAGTPQIKVAIYTMATITEQIADDTVIGTPITKVTGSDATFAVDNSVASERRIYSYASDVILTANTWYCVGIVGGQAFTDYPNIRRNGNTTIQYSPDTSYQGWTNSGDTDYTFPASYSAGDTNWATATAFFYTPTIYFQSPDRQT